MRFPDQKKPRWASKQDGDRLRYHIRVEQVQDDNQLLSTLEFYLHVESTASYIAS